MQLARATTDVLWLVADGKVEPFDGDLDDYQRYLLNEAKRAREDLKESLKTPQTAPVAAAPPVTAVKKAPVNLKALKLELGKLEQAILDLQTKKHALVARLATPLPAQEIGELAGDFNAKPDHASIAPLLATPHLLFENHSHSADLLHTGRGGEHVVQ